MIGDESKENPAEQLSRLLVALGRSQDGEAFKTLFEYFAPRLKAFLMRRGTLPDVAEEILQETMVKVWRKAKQFDPVKASVSTWVFAIARNTRIDMLRNANRPEPDFNDPAMVPDPEPHAYERISREQEAARLRAILAGLQQEQHTVLRLAFFEGKPHAQIAEELGIPLGTVKSRIRLAIRRVRAEFGERE